MGKEDGYNGHTRGIRLDVGTRGFVCGLRGRI